MFGTLTPGLCRRAMSSTAVITGGSSGIGREVAALFKGRGWEVHNISRLENHVYIKPCLGNRTKIVRLNFRPPHAKSNFRSPCTVPGVINHAADLSRSSDAEEVGKKLAGWFLSPAHQNFPFQELDILGEQRPWRSGSAELCRLYTVPHDTTRTLSATSILK
jgi:NAD(P)-dependent dehydrogenase (short-subunit alcohol dehydrogenase family)